MKAPQPSNPRSLSGETVGDPIPTDVAPAMASDHFIKSRIFTIRGVQAMLDRDLAVLYGVGTKVLNQAVRRNLDRFPMRFMFQLSEQESANLKSQIVTSSWGGRRYLPAAKNIVLVDNYCDDTTLDLLSQKRGGASVTIATTPKSASKFLTPAAVAKFNKQNPPLAVVPVAAFHDRFLILDGTELYHFGASLKDLGRQYCAVTKMDPMFIPSIMQRL